MMSAAGAGEGDEAEDESGIVTKVGPSTHVENIQPMAPSILPDLRADERRRPGAATSAC
jgi:hypothetical protein